MVLCGTHLDDNNWHSVHYMRRAHEIYLKVDNVTVKSSYYRSNHRRTLGNIYHFFSDNADMEDKITLKWQGLLIGGLSPKDPEAMANLPSYIGSIQQFIVNKINYFELAKISTKVCKYLPLNIL